ncbi:M20 family metallopeptidase [Alicyclobacillus kakegawensis]|uniref:M20 family metallopeptidase n=1 Tax=Alicyclobacillus kakegawensis TaxID=392012 RepID=UPI000829A6C8|nr:M20 family metallopeptidase [Alicyclobacillus kakegawensis]
MSREPVEFLKQIVRIPSVNPPGNEREVALALQVLLERYGLETRRTDFDGGRANLVAWLRGNHSGGGKRILGLSGHMDVVPPGQVPWCYDPFSAVEENGRIYGRGTSDMKGGLAALAFAMIELKEEGARLNGDVKLLASAGEEAGSVGAKRLFAAGEMDEVTALIIAEPTRDHIVVGQKGALWVEITCFGKTAHGSSPELGVNAIVHMHRIIDAFLNRFRMEYTPDDLLGHPTSNIAIIQGGVNTNVVPDHCRVQIDFRTVPSQKHERILQELNALIASVEPDCPGLHAELRVLNDLPSVRTRSDDPFLATVTEGYKEVFNAEPTIRGTNGYTDAAELIPPGHNKPFVIIGSGDDRLSHQPDESIEVERFLRSIELYKSMIRKYLQ